MLPNNSNVHFHGESHVPPVFGVSDDFVQRPNITESADTGAWLSTLVDGDTDGADSITVMDDEPGGVLRVLTNDADNDGQNVQLNGSPFKLNANRLRFSARIRVSDADQCDWFVGLAAPDTDILGGVTERVGFQVDSSSTDQEVECVSEDGGTETNEDSGVTVADATWLNLAFEWIPRTATEGRLLYYINGEQVATVTTNVPVSDDMTLAFQVRKDGTGADSLDLDWIECFQSRG